MAKLRPDWSKSSIKKLVARLKAVVILELCTLASDPSQRLPVLRWTSSGPNYPRCLGVSVAYVAKKAWDLLLHSVAGAAQQMGEKSLQNNPSSADLSCYPSPSPGVLSL